MEEFALKLANITMAMMTAEALASHGITISICLSPPSWKSTTVARTTWARKSSSRREAAEKRAVWKLSLN